MERLSPQCHKIVIFFRVVAKLCSASTGRSPVTTRFSVDAALFPLSEEAPPLSSRG